MHWKAAQGVADCVMLFFFYLRIVDMALSCVVFACSQVPLMGNIANNSRPLAKSPMKPGFELFELVFWPTMLY